MNSPLHIVAPVTGLTCASCVSRLEKSLSKRDGVQSVSVNLALETMDINLADDATLTDLPKWVDATGFGLETEQALMTVSNMTCASCVSRIEKSLNKMPGISTAQVNLATNQLKVEWFSGLTNAHQIKQRLASINYPVVESTEVERHEKDESKTLLRQSVIGLALATPMVITMMATFFGADWMLPAWLQFALTTPVQFWLGLRFYRGAFHALKNKSANMDVLVAMGTSAAYFYSIYLWWFTTTVHLYFEAAAVVISLVMLGKWMEERAKFVASDAIRKLIKLQPRTAKKWQGDELVSVSIDELTVGDELQIQPGDTVPADGLVLSGYSSLNEAMLTGESLPVEKNNDDTVYAGTHNGDGSLRIRVNQSPEQFRLKQIVDLVNDAQMQKPDIQKLVDKISSVFVPTVIVIALIAFILQWLFQSLDTAFIAAVSVLVIACPCALGLATPTAIMAASGVGARRGVLIRDINQLHTLAKAKDVVFDKTGTLTIGEPTVVNEYWFNERGDLKSWIKAIEQQSQHPLAQAMVHHLRDISALKDDISFENISGQGVISVSNNQKLLIGNERLMTEHGVSIDNTSQQAEHAHASQIWVALDSQLVARFAVTDPLRQEAKTVVSWLQKEDKMVWLLSGDTQNAADAIAKEVGIEHIMANLLPEHKAQAIKQLKKKSTGVVMIGDGINDAPALASADASVAIGSGTDVALEAAGIALMRPNLGLVTEAIQIARKTQLKIKQNLFWAFIYNCIGIPLAAFGLLSPIIAGAAMAFSSVSVVSSSLLLLRWNPTALEEVKHD